MAEARTSLHGAADEPDTDEPDGSDARHRVS
jgi:hypothetical protein